MGTPKVAFAPIAYATMDRQESIGNRLSPQIGKSAIGKGQKGLRNLNYSLLGRVLDVVEVLGVLDFPTPLSSGSAKRKVGYGCGPRHLWQYFTQQEARKICLGRILPRVLLRLCGSHPGCAAA